MEVHQHTHTERKKLKHYLFEFLMLFLAVFAGFLAENFREHVVENNRAKEYAAALIQDLERDTVRINQQVRTYKIFVQIVDTMLSMSKQGLTPANTGLFKFYSRFVMWSVALPWNRVTLDQLKSSGGLRYFRDYSLVKKITEYDTREKSIDAEFENHTHRSFSCLDLINKIIEPDVHEQASRVLIYALDTMSAKTMSEFVEEKSEPLDSKKEEIKELLNMCVVQKRNMNVTLKNPFPQIKKLAIELIKDLRKEYNLSEKTTSKK